MIRPGFLKEGDTVGVTAPSAGASDPLDTVRFENAKKNLVGKGYRVRYTSNVFGDIGGGRSSPAEQRAAELESLINDPEVRYIVSAGGGDWLNEIFPYLDMSGLSNDPKWIQGYSDNTDILLAATVDYGVMSIYCGNFGDYGMEPWHESIGQNLEFVEGKRMCQTSFSKHAAGFSERITGLEPFDCSVPTEWVSDDVVLEGRLIGGCTDKLREIVGSDRDRMHGFAERYREDGILWYMETFASDRDGITADLRSMENAGWFENATGFVFGRPIFYETPDYEDAVRSAIGHLGLPIVFGADVGHLAPRMTFVNGALARISVSGGKAVLEYPEFRTKEY